MWTQPDRIEIETLPSAHQAWRSILPKGIAVPMWLHQEPKNVSLIRDSYYFLKHAEPCDVLMIQNFPVLQAKVDICVFIEHISSF